MNEISSPELKAMMDRKEKFILLDCRGVDYFNWEHIPGAINIRWKYINERAPKILKDKHIPIVTTCNGFTCTSSIRCSKKLRKLGYKTITEHPGGIADWIAHGYPSVQDSSLRIAPNVYRFPDQTFYGEPVGSYLIDEDDFILLIDGPQQLTDEHQNFILNFDKPIKMFMTHNPTAGETPHLQKKYKAKIYLHRADKNGEWLTVKPDVCIENNYKFNDHLTVLHVPGHTPGSSVLLDSTNKILFSGDHIEGTKDGEIYDFFKHLDGTEGDVEKRFESAEKLLDFDFEKILPFHYDMILGDGKGVLKRFINKYKQRK